MPELPAVLASLANRSFSKRATVCSVDDFHPALRRVGFVVPQLRGSSVRPGVQIEILVSKTSMRHYTPAAFNSETGVMEVVFFLSDLGPGSAWARSLCDGDVVGILGPGGKFGLSGTAEHHVLIGDETCIGLFEILSGESSNVRGVFEVRPDMVTAAAALDPRLEAVSRRERGAGLEIWLSENWPLPEEHIYLCGHRETIRILRQMLLAKGHPRRNISTMPYWADRRRGL